MYVNLGIGMPTTTASYIDPNITVHLHSENGMIGTGPYPEPGKEDPELINAGKETVTIIPGGSYIKSSDAFSMIRGNHLDLTMLGTLQVSTQGDVANWTIRGKLLKGMGGAMDLVSNTKRVHILTSLLDSDGNPKIVNHLSLPATGKRAADLIITDYGVFKVAHPGHELHKETISGESNLTMLEISKDTSKEEVKSLLKDVSFKFVDDLKIMEDCSSQHNADLDEWEEIDHFFD